MKARALHPGAAPGIGAATISSGDIDLTRLFRAHVEPAYWRDTELTVFISAWTARDAHERIVAAIALMERRTQEDVRDRVYNVASGNELVEDGLSEDHALRLFETGWSGGKPSYFVCQPLFLVSNPAPLIRKWAAIPPRPEP